MNRRLDVCLFSHQRVALFIKVQHAALRESQLTRDERGWTSPFIRSSVTRDWCHMRRNSASSWTNIITYIHSYTYPLSTYINPIQYFKSPFNCQLAHWLLVVFISAFFTHIGSYIELAAASLWWTCVTMCDYALVNMNSFIWSCTGTLRGSTFSH